MKALTVDTTTDLVVKDDISKNLGSNIKITKFNKQGKEQGSFTGEINGIYDNGFSVKREVNNYPINNFFSYAQMATTEYEYDISNGF